MYLSDKLFKIFRKFKIILKHFNWFVLSIIDAKDMMLPASACLQIVASCISLMDGARGGERKHTMEGDALQN